MHTLPLKHLLARRLTAGILLAAITIPVIAGPCTNYANNLRQLQMQRATAQIGRLNTNVDGIGSISRQLSQGCWDQIVGLDMGSVGMPPILARMTIRRLNEACEALVQKAVATANQQIGNVTGQLGGMLSLGGNSGILSDLQASWGRLSQEDRADAIAALDAMQPGAGAAFQQAQQAGSGGFGVPSLPSGSGSFGGSMGPVTTTETKSFLEQVGGFFSPSR